jgi:DNA polymerase V
MAIYHVLADVNAAYVSFCSLFNPKWNGKPLGVLGSNEGNVIARNQMLKNLGVKMADPAYIVKPIIEKNGGYLFGSNFTLFGDMSDRFHTELEELIMSPERYSVDEAFGLLDTNCIPDLNAYAKHIQDTIKQNLGLEIGVGIGRTKTLCKLASWFSKEQRWKDVTHGVAVLDTIEKENWVLKRVPVIQIWGCGKKTSEKLEKQDIHTGLTLRDSDLKQMQSRYGIQIERTILELRGSNAIDIKSSTDAREQICVSKSMGIPITDITLMNESLSSHVKNASFKLRRQNSWCRKMTVFVGTNSFKKDDAQHHQSLAIELPHSTQSTVILTKYALFILERLYQKGFNYRKTGVILSDFTFVKEMQPDMFGVDEPENFALVDNALDKINAKFGKGAVRLAVEGFNKSWRPKDNLAPPSYTTNIMELPTTK